MKNETIFIKIEPETKAKVKEICRKERRSITSLILFLLDKKLGEYENGRV